MAKVVVKSKVKKVKRKFPVKVQAPEYLSSVELGESSVTDLNSVVGKTSKMNMMYVTGNVKNQNIRLTFKITEVNSGLAKTTVSVYEQIPYYLGRFVKKGSDLVEDSFTVKSKDGLSVRVKPFIVTKQNTSTMVLSSIRLKFREVAKKEFESISYDEIMSSIISGKYQNVFRNELKKVFPLKVFEFKKAELV